jgi:DNA-binding XRE family transcriptional regulator
MKDQLKLLVDIRGLRREAKVGLDAAAELLGVNRSSLARIETGTKPSLIDALKIARFLHLPVEQIWSFAEKKRATKPGRGKNGSSS